MQVWLVIDNESGYVDSIWMDRDNAIRAALAASAADDRPHHVEQRTTKD